jgi:hypothetical protein
MHIDLIILRARPRWLLYVTTQSPLGGLLARHGATGSAAATGWASVMMPHCLIILRPVVRP